MPRLGEVKDRIGIRYGRLTVLKSAGQTWDGRSLWLCKCDCGEEIIARGEDLQSKHTKSCSCLHQEITSSRTGEDNPNYKHGKGCGIVELRKLKESIRKRDNYICQECGKTQEQNLKEVDRKLEVHHIDGDDTNNVLKNMIALCKSCHSKQKGI